MWLVVVALLTLGFVFLAREAEATEFVRRAINRSVVKGRLPVYRAKARPLTLLVYLVARFLDALLACVPCIAAWASVPSLLVYWTIGQVNEIAGALIVLFVAGPVSAVGLLYAFTLLSPAQAMAAALAGLARFKSKATDEKKTDGGEGGGKKDSSPTGC